MLKKILVAAISAQLIFAPAQAETIEKKPVQCTKGFVGVDDIMFFAAISYVVINSVLIISKIMTKGRDDELKAKQKQEQPELTAPNCKL